MASKERLLARGRVLIDSDGVERDSSNPTPVAVISGNSAGTEYVEDAAAAANPSGGALILVRRDTLSASEVSADGDNVAAKATSKGELRVSDADLAAAIYTEDAASAANPIGLMILARRRDTLVTNEVSAEGDNIALNATNKGQLHVYAEGPQTNPEFLAALRSATATQTSINSTTAETLGLAANANRKGAKIINTDANVLWLVYRDTSGATPDATNYYEALATGEDHIVDFGYTGAITFAWSGDGAGVAIVWEVTA
jgi:hypothetical protein